MKKSEKRHAIRLYILINAAVVFSTLVEFLGIPSDAKNAWILGFSKTRLIAAGSLLILLLTLIWLAYRYLFSSARADQATRSLQNHIGKIWLFDIYFFLFSVLFIFSSVLGARLGDYPESSPNSYVIIRAYPLLALVMAIAFTTVLILLYFRQKRNSAYRRFFSWLNLQLTKRNVEAIALAVLVIIFLMIGQQYITDEKIYSDGLQTSNLSYSLFKTGSIADGKDENGEPKYSARREPLPIIIGAANLSINPAFDEDFNAADLNKGNLARSYKSVNLLWTSLFLLSIYFLSKKLFGYPLLAILSSSALTYFVVIRSRHFDRAIHEVASLSLMVLSSLLFVRLISKPDWKKGILFGLSLGLLALTKASVFYVGLVFFLVLAIVFQLEKRLTKKNMLIIFLALLAFALPTLGWMTRNNIRLDSFALSERGGDVFYNRLLRSRHPMWGVVFAHSPPVFRDIIAEFSGYTEADLAEGGRLADLVQGNPSYIPYHRKDIYDQLLIDARADGAVINTRLEFDAFLMAEALSEIRSDPQDYLRGTPGLAWRGIWVLGTEQYGFTSKIAQDLLLPVLNLTLFVSFIAIIPYALINKNYPLAAVFIFPFGMYLFHALLSHNQNRFNYSMEPYLWLSILIFFLDGLALASGQKRLISKSIID